MNKTKKPEFPWEAVSGEGFIADYIVSRQKKTEAPLEFHFGVAVTLVAAALGGSTWWPAPRKFPSIWMLLVASSTVYRKSTAISLGMDLLAKAFPERILPNILSSREGLFERLSLSSTGFLETGELAPLLEGNSAKGFLSFMTEIFDSPAHKERRTARGKSYVLNTPTLTWLAGSTPAWLLKLTRESDIYGGFWPRWAFILPPDDSPDPLPNPEALNEDEEEILSNQLKSLVADEPAPAFVTDAAEEAREQTYLRNRQRILAAGEGPEQPFLSRADDLTIKLALIFAASEQSFSEDGRVWVDAEHVERAAMIAEYFGRSALWTLRGMTSSKAQREKRRVLGIVERWTERHQTPMPYANLLRNYGENAATLRPVLETLLAEGSLKEVPAEGTRAFEPTTSAEAKFNQPKLKKIS